MSTGAYAQPMSGITNTSLHDFTTGVAFDGVGEAGVEGTRLRPLSNAHDLPAICKQLMPALRARGPGCQGAGAGTVRAETGLTTSIAGLTSMLSRPQRSSLPGRPTP